MKPLFLQSVSRVMVVTCIPMLAFLEYSLETDDNFKMLGASGLEVVLMHILMNFSNWCNLVKSPTALNYLPTYMLIRKASDNKCKGSGTVPL